MRLITWNVARRLRSMPDQAAALFSREPDVVCLQEVTTRGGGLWAAAFERIGLPHVRHSVQTRSHSVLIASRTALAPAERLPLPWPESSTAAVVEGVEIHCVHIPNALNGWTKVRSLEAMRRGLAERTGPRVVCGDFNTPRREHPDGSVHSFAYDTRLRLRPERGEEWDAAERGVVPGLRELGFKDCFRTLHGYRSREPSWVFSHGGGWRLDHAFVSAELEPLAARYHHRWRDEGLSDHSALEIELA
jgi:exonuclease III